MKKIKYPDSDLMAMDLADLLAAELNAILNTKERVSFVVPGGTTPGPIFDILSAVPIEWERINILLTDERWVPEDDERSNTRLVREHLLVDKAAAATFLPLYKPADRPEDVLPDLAAQIAPLLPVDVVMLGMGEDMHTASLFPGGDRLAEAFEDDAPILLPMRAPGLEEPRITLTAPVISGAMSRHIVFRGKAKNKALKKAIKINDPLQAPISAFVKDATVHWMP